MSKIYNQYVLLKIRQPYKKYLFKSGIFYIFIDEDAKELSGILNLKLSMLNSNIVKCGFPMQSLDKYMKILKDYGYAVEIVDLSNNSISNYDNYKESILITSFLKNISEIKVDSLSISQTYDLLEDFKQQASNILYSKNIGDINEKKK